jgi:hypothetical protein
MMFPIDLRMKIKLHRRQTPLPQATLLWIKADGNHLPRNTNSVYQGQLSVEQFSAHDVVALMLDNEFALMLII